MLYYYVFISNLYVFPSWYFGKLKRLEAEKRLLHQCNDHGAFLVRDSESRRDDYSLSGEPCYHSGACLLRDIKENENICYSAPK